MIGVLVYGSTFWVLIMILTNVINLKISKQEPSYVTTVCHAGFKECISVSQDFMSCSYLLHECKSSRVFIQPEPRTKLDQKPKTELSFTKEENFENVRRCKINKFLDAKTCKYLCRQFSAILNQEENHCEDLCFTLSRSEKTAGEICPYEKYCPEGCPCPYYDCEKSVADRQKLSPAWDLSSSRKVQIESTELIYSRDTIWDELPNQKRETNIISTHQIIFYDHGNGSKKIIDTSRSKSFEKHGVGSTFFDGRHYLVDAKANMFKVDEIKSELELVVESQRLGYFMFHFYSAIGTYRIKTAHKEEFGVVVICSSNSLSDKCFYYAPDRNLHRFEFGQGLVANNHWNAKTTAFTWEDRFYLISLRYGENNMRTSHTLSIDPFRIAEENVKGWKKETKSFPSELNGLEPVDVIPLVDHDRLLFVIISRSRELSNVKYSLFLNLNSQLVDIGSEWMGNLAQYSKYDLCFSALFAMNDPFYNLPGRDECEYFQNSFIVNDRIYIQSLIFDSTFEMDFDFENLELVFTQKTKHESIMLASNPDFAYHDDVFPGFSKNAVSQQNFPKHRCGGMEYCVVIIPQLTFNVNERAHISSVDFKDDWKFSFQIIGFGRDENAIEIVLQSGEAFLTISASGRLSSMQLNIQIGAKRIAVIPEMIEAATEIEIHFDKLEGKAIIFQVKPSIRDGITGTKKTATLLREVSVPKNVFPSQNTRLKVFAKNLKLRDFYYFLHYESTMVLITHMPEYCTECNMLRITSASGFYSSDVKLKFPTDNIYTFNQYLTNSKAAMIRGIAYFFGGEGGFVKGEAKKENLRKIAYLDGCKVKEHQTRLGIYADAKASAVSFEEDGRSFAIVCFDIYERTGSTGDFGNFRDKGINRFFVVKFTPAGNVKN